MDGRNVKVIQPTIARINAERKQRAASYCRVSTDSEDQANSFAAQLKYYTDYIKTSPDMEFIDIYADEGITGTCISQRDEFQRMMRDAAKGKLDRIYTKSVSRFARNSLECIEAIRKLAVCGVSVLFENDNIDTKSMNSELILYVKSAFAQSEALAGSRRVATSFRMKMENGSFVTTNAPFGYTVDERGTLKALPEQAEIVRHIFDLYLSGWGAERIAETLNKECTMTDHGRWQAPSIRYILTNEKYIGDSLWQKTYTPQAFPLKNVPNKGQADKFYVSHTHEAIISREIFEAAQRRMHRNGVNNRCSQPQGVFQRRVFCETCGWGYKRKVSNEVVYWVCSGKSVAGQTCVGPSIREDALKKAFVMMYNKLRFFEKEVLDTTLKQLQQVREKISGQSGEISQMDLEIARLCETKNMYTQLHGQGIIDEVSFLERTSELKYKITELRRKRLKLLNSNEDEQLIENLRTLKDILNESPEVILGFNQQLFQDIIEKVLVGKDNSVVFQLKGGLSLRQPFGKDRM